MKGSVIYKQGWAQVQDVTTWAQEHLVLSTNDCVVFLFMFHTVFGKTVLLIYNFNGQGGKDASGDMSACLTLACECFAGLGSYHRSN